MFIRLPTQKKSRSDENATLLLNEFVDHSCVKVLESAAVDHRVFP